MSTPIEVPPPPAAVTPEPSREPSSEPERAPDRPPSQAERRRDGRAMVPVLAQALASQLDRIAGDDPAPDGWWFTPQR
ncbi:hypothetical protein [Actinomycetospora termitidis]|uniref:Uncharacterized protein n=1 Tax=Actinomycetospora termitidis TaxID=3053470 RepID=A0ABT7MJA6_9PSEU|nr:hypothetical protein [Actinomycetospora sp. Odt1-22]MDL5160304.1 hypothetical protein [Actinomycetospora sp. Odt1-22]